MENTNRKKRAMMVSDNDLKCKDYVKSNITGKCINVVEDDSGVYCKIPTQFRCPLAIQSSIFKLSHSTVQDYLICKRKFWLKNIIGVQIRPHKKSLPLKRGGLWDKLQGLFYGICKASDIKGYIELVRMPEMEVARIKGLYKAFRECVKPVKKDLIGLQQHFNYQHYDTTNGDVLVHGYYDRLYPTWFAECKLTAKPQYYEDPFYMRSQVGTYFLAKDELECVNLEVTKLPDQHPYKKGRNRTCDEMPNEFKVRVYNDVITRPAYYFKGYKRKTKTYGWDFARSEFSPSSLRNRYRQIIREIKECSQRKAWYENDKGCMIFDKECEFAEICKTYTDGYFSVDTDNIYEIRQKTLDEGLGEFIKDNKQKNNLTGEREA